MPAVCRINREQGFDSGRITSPSDHPSARRSAIAILGFFADECTTDVLKLVRGSVVQTLQCLLVPLCLYTQHARVTATCSNSKRWEKKLAFRAKLQHKQFREPTLPPSPFSHSWNEPSLPRIRINTRSSKQRRTPHVWHIASATNQHKNTNCLLHTSPAP